MTAGSAGNGVPVPVRRWPDSAFLLLCGAVLLLLNGAALLLLRADFPWGRALPLADVWFLNVVFVFWLPSGDARTGLLLPKKVRLPAQLPFLALWALLFGRAIIPIPAPWSLGCMGMAVAAAFIGIGRVVRRRPYYAAAAGWCLAGGAVLFVPECDPFALFFFLGGALTLGQGLDDLIRSPRLHVAAQSTLA